MKLPLPADTFPPLDLTPADVEMLEGIAEHFIQERMLQFHEHAVLRKGVVDPHKWKRVRQREQVTVYKERKMDKGSIIADEQTDIIPGVMATGTIQGSLDDVMYGVINHTTEEMRIHSSYVEDSLADMAMLASLVKPSTEDPLRSLSIKWAIKDSPKGIPSSVVRLRDHVYLESTGLAFTAAGERIGYQLLHSVQFPSIQELHEYKIVRANISFCYLYQQVAPNVVSVYMRGVMNPFGSVAASVTVYAASESLVSTCRNFHCAQMKKLMWLVRSANIKASWTEMPTDCSVCTQPLKPKSSFRKCCACQGRVCSRCSVVKALSYILPTKPREASIVKLRFCTRCILRATQTSALDVAAQDVVDAEAAVRLSVNTMTRRQTDGSISESSA